MRFDLLFSLYFFFFNSIRSLCGSKMGSVSKTLEFIETLEKPFKKLFEFVLIVAVVKNNSDNQRRIIMGWITIQVNIECSLDCFSLSLSSLMRRRSLMFLFMGFKFNDDWIEDYFLSEHKELNVMSYPWNIFCPKTSLKTVTSFNKNSTKKIQFLKIFICRIKKIKTSS